MSRILYKSFRYTHSSKTDISKTFKRERERLKEEAEKKAAAETEVQSKVRIIKERKA